MRVGVGVHLARVGRALVTPNPYPLILTPKALSPQMALRASGEPLYVTVVASGIHLRHSSCQGLA